MKLCLKNYMDKQFSHFFMMKCPSYIRYKDTTHIEYIKGLLKIVNNSITIINHWVCRKWYQYLNIYEITDSIFINPLILLKQSSYGLLFCVSM